VTRANLTLSLVFVASVWLLAACGQPSSREASSSSPPAPVGLPPPAPTLNIPLPAIPDEELRAAEAFYRGKVVRIMVGSGAGGGFDTTARLVARHIPKHIPGNPTVIVENMPGGGGLVAANHLFHVAEKTGLVIGIFQEVQVMNQLTGAEGVQFDLRKFNWLGSSFDDPNVCLVRTDAPVTSFEQMLRTPKPILFGGTGPGSNVYDVPRIVAAATGANMKAVAGYGTTNEVRIGIERGELHGICIGWESVKSALDQWLRDKFIRIVVQNGPKPNADLRDVPMAESFAKDEDSKALLRVVDAPGAIAKPFTFPPGVDESRVRVMRRALLSTYQDPQFLREANAMKFTFQPKTADQIQQILDEVLATPPHIAAKYKQIIGL
jgi:tripartite-type tricarboxylate transporter receptor subunit TctC